MSELLITHCTNWPAHGSIWEHGFPRLFTTGVSNFWIFAVQLYTILSHIQPYKSACNEGDLGSIPGLGRSPREGKGYPLNASILAWRIPGCKESGMTERPSQPCSFSKSIKSIYIIYLFLSVLALHCCVWAFSSCCQRGLLFAVVLGFFIAMVSLVPEHRL